MAVMVSDERTADFDAAIGPRELLLRHGAYSMTGEPETEAEGGRIGEAALGYAWHGWPIAPGAMPAWRLAGAANPPGPRPPDVAHLPASTAPCRLDAREEG
jgi:hypothetical protein